LDFETVSLSYLDFDFGLDLDLKNLNPLTSSVGSMERSMDWTAKDNVVNVFFLSATLIGHRICASWSRNVRHGAEVAQPDPRCSQQVAQALRHSVAQAE